MLDNSKEAFLSQLKLKNIDLSDEDFNQSYKTYLNFRKIYASMKNQDIDNLEPRQRYFGE